MRPLLISLLFVFIACAQAAPLKTRNVILVSIDGLRWQEVFRGGEDSLLSKENGGIPPASVNEVRRKFLRASNEERRATLMPFVWNHVAKTGRLLGNRDNGSQGKVTNAFNFSYPGYSEFLCGYADDKRVKSNEAIPNPNVTVLEWLQQKPQFAGKIAAYNAWGVLPAILNQQRSAIPMWTPGDRSEPGTAGPAQLLIEELVAGMPKLWSNETCDVFTFRAAKEFLSLKKPRVFYINFGEPDEWAHAGRYDRYLASIQNADRFIRELWETAQSLPEFRDSTTLILSCDHGRGAGPATWTSHGADLPESSEVWLAAMGPDTNPPDNAQPDASFTLSQIAATLAAFLGEDYCNSQPKAAQPIPTLFAH